MEHFDAEGKKMKSPPSRMQLLKDREIDTCARFCVRGIKIVFINRGEQCSLVLKIYALVYLSDYGLSNAQL